MLVMSLRADLMTPEGASDALAYAPASNANTANAIRFLLVSMIGHPLRHRLRLVRPGVPGHQDEEREIHQREDSRGVRIGRGSRLQTEVAERQEAERERNQEAAVQPAAVADRLHARAVEPRHEEERQHGGAHQYYAEQLARHGAQDRVERREVPRRRDVLRRPQRIRGLEVGVLEE